MRKRSFLLAGAGALAGAVAGVPVKAASVGRQADHVKVIDTPITNRDQFADVAWPPPGTALTLQRCPQRVFDPRSVQVCGPDSRALGYLPPVAVPVLAALMDHGICAHAVAGAAGRVAVYVDA